MKIKLSQIDLPEIDLRMAIDEDALDELAASLRDHGQLQPIGVKQTANDRYEVVFGARRTRAAHLNFWDEIEATIVEESTTNNTAASKLIENVQRLDMTPLEEASGLAALIADEIPNVRTLQRQTGKSRDWIQTRLALLELHEDLQAVLQLGLISIGVARAFGRVENDDVRTQYIKQAIEFGCTTAQAESMAANWRFAETGIMTMDELQKAGLEPGSMPQVVDQIYHCFVCATATNWRRVNIMPICGDCQDVITNGRHVHHGPPPTYPVDTENGNL